MNASELGISPSIVIAGASGYIGKALIPRLLEKFPQAQITALSRSSQNSNDPRIHWRACDLFSRVSIEEILPDRVDLAIYLVHSMGPTAQLDQGSFADYDLLLADNFAAAIQPKGIKQLIYLGGLVSDSNQLSLHLQSRVEIEETFLQYSFPTTIFRAGLILGEAGSSFQILLKLVKRLPVMICPSWTQTYTTPVDLDSVLFAMTSSALAMEHVGKIYDLAGCQPLTYVQMMQETARKLGLKRYFMTVPFFTPTLSRLWVSLITNSPRELVYPLIESLEHPMVARETHRFPNLSANRSYFDLLARVSMKTSNSNLNLFRFKAKSKTVRSVQRLPLPPGQNALWVKDQYISWLPQFLSPFIKVQVQGEEIAFAVFHPRLVMLRIRFNSERSDVNRQVFLVIGGFLASSENRGRLVFRTVLGQKYVLAAIHEFRPALPWYLYVFTQAPLHVFIMNAFSRYLARMATPLGYVN